MMAMEMCQDMKTLIKLKQLKQGKIHSIFPHALNVMTPSQEVITLLNHTQGMTPLALRINMDKPFTSIGFQIGMSVGFDDERIVFHDLFMMMSIHGAEEWNPAPYFTNERDSLEHVMVKQQWMKGYIDKQGNEEGIRGIIQHIRKYMAGEAQTPQLNPSQQFIFKRLTDFLEAIKEKKVTELSRLTKEIVGFGPGLTPAVDDFIAGIMLTSIYLSHYLGRDLREAQDLNQEIIKGIRGRTTSVSEKALRLAAKGHASESVRQLMKAYLSKGEDQRFHKWIEEVMALGSTSGTDLLCGIEIASQMMLLTNGGGKNDEV